MKFNEAQRAVLRDYDDGKHAHLVDADSQSFAVNSVHDPVLHLLLTNASEAVFPANKPCEIVSSILVLETLKLEITSRNQEERSDASEIRTAICF